MAEAGALRVHMFDSVLPTRLGRDGTVLSSGGRYHVRNASFARDPGPLDAACPCPLCARWSGAYLRHLLQVGDRGAGRLITLHNLAWTMSTVTRAREAVMGGRYAAFRHEVAGSWAGRR